MSQTRTCDECQKASSRENVPKEWLHIEQLRYGGFGDLQLDFCSWACVAKYGTKHSKK